MGSRYFDLRTGLSDNLDVTYANTVVNDAISLVFGTQNFEDYDCTGKTCMRFGAYDGIVMVEDTCEGY